jgi:hypothetical protein
MNTTPRSAPDNAANCYKNIYFNNNNNKKKKARIEVELEQAVEKCKLAGLNII